MAMSCPKSQKGSTQHSEHIDTKDILEKVSYDGDDIFEKVSDDAKDKKNFDPKKFFEPKIFSTRLMSLCVVVTHRLCN